MAIFYGLYVDNARLAAAFDIVRFLCEPNFFRRTHITVRGPYDDNHLIDLSNDLKKRTYKIYFNGPERFSATQSTVFLRCEIPGIEQVWDKPDYSEGITPHLTFYDNKADRGFGYNLLDELNAFPWGFSCHSTPLEKIASKSRPIEIDKLEIHQEVFGDLFGSRMNPLQFRSESKRQRLVRITYILKFIHDQFGAAA